MAGGEPAPAGSANGSPRTSIYAIAGGTAIGVAVGLAAAWSVKRLRDHELLAPVLDGYHAIATVLVIYGLAEVAGTYGFLAAFAGGLAFRRYEADHEANTSVHQGAELTEKLLELSVILLLGSLLTLDRPRAAGLGGLAARRAADRGGAPARLSRGAGGLEARAPDRPPVRRVVRRARSRLAVLHGGRGRRRRARGRGARRAHLDRDRVRAALDRRPRHQRGAGDAADSGGHSLQTSRVRTRVDEVEHRRLELGLVDRQLARTQLPATRSSAGRIVSRASNASNTRGSM